MDIQKEREAFEEYIISKHKNRSPLILTQRIQHGFSENYIVQGVQDCWETWQAAKAQAVPEKDAVIKKLSDQLYAQEMKTSAARVLCETACELLDGYAHQDAMVILNDLEQAMKEPADD